MKFAHSSSAFNNKNILRLILVSLLCFMLNGVSLAQKPNYPTGNPTGIAGTGNAITDSDNFFLRNNIAGLTEIPLNEEEEITRIKTKADKGSWRFNGEIQLLAFRHNVESASRPGLIGKGTSLTPNFAGEITYTSADHRFGFGAGSYQVINFNNRLLGNPFFTNQPEARFINTDIAIAGAFRVNKRLSIGAGIIFSRTSIATVVQSANLLTRRELDGVGGLGATVGIHYRPTNYLSFGANYKSKRTNMLSSKEKIAFLSPPRPEIEWDSVSEIEIGTTLEVGVAVKPHEKLLLACDFRYFDYSVESRSPEVSGGVLRDIQTFHSGLKYSLTKRITISFGITTSCQNRNENCISTRDAIGTGISGGISRRFGDNRSISFGFTAFPGDTIKQTIFNDFNNSKERGFLFSIGLQTRR